MAEYVLAEDDDQEQVVQGLLKDADDPASVSWSPRPNTPHGGVYIVPDALAEKAIKARQDRRDAEAKRITDAQAAADKRDTDPAVQAGLATPSEAGFPADTVVTEDTPEDAADEAVVDDPSTPEDEHAEAENRVAARRAARKAAGSTTEKSE
jgi:hypothetical protein